MWRFAFLVSVFLFAISGRAGAEDLEHCYRGEGAHEAGDYELAITYYTKCIETGNLSAFNRATVYFNRANAYSDLNDHEKAIRDYDEAIRLDPLGADLFINRGLAYANQSNYGQAVLDFNEAIYLNPGLGLAYQNRCMADRVVENWDVETPQDLDDARAFDPSVPSWEERFRAFERLGQE